MARNVTCGLDSFARGIEELVGDIPASCQEKVGKATEQATRKGVKTVKKHAKKGGVHKWSDAYVGGFSSRVRKGAVTEGEIGNKAKPGLVHLLEKGHLTLTERRTRAFPHMAPAFDEIQDDFVERVEKAVGEALR
ncbi:MAG: hypothetical protein IJ092_06295 [Atopobiaceae bacterium]|nr:hypothetical protein [Atopobiaceae bacterium]